MIILKYSSTNNVMIMCSSLTININVKQAWTGPEGSRLPFMLEAVSTPGLQCGRKD
jgi:hypothetical protein